MPIYDYECPACQAVTEAKVAYDQREAPIPCGSCGKPSVYVLVRTGVQIGTEVIRGDRRLITDERQVHNDHGPRWRDKGVTGPGGAGKVKYFT